MPNRGFEVLFILAGGLTTLFMGILFITGEFWVAVGAMLVTLGITQFIQITTFIILEELRRDRERKP